MRRVDDRVEQIRAHFDALGEGEWARLVATPRVRVTLELHTRMLRRFIRPGARVLEIGAGPGRFTIPLARLGARVVVTDLSATQLALNREKVAEAGCEHAVDDRAQLDIRDLSRFPDASFDGVVAYGGPLSYVFEQAPRALAECLRVTRAGGVVLASVMSLVGTTRFLMPNVLREVEAGGVQGIDHVIQTGDLRPSQPTGHVCQMYRWREVEALIAEAPCRLLAASASSAISPERAELLVRVAADPELWTRFLDWEERLAQEPGALDGGTHILFAVERVETR